MHWIGHLDDDGAHRRRKRRVAYERKAQLVVEVPVMVLAKADDIGLLPRAKNLVDDAGVSLLGLAGGGTREGQRNHLQQEYCSESGRHRHVNLRRMHLGAMAWPTDVDLDWIAPWLIRITLISIQRILCRFGPSHFPGILSELFDNTSMLQQVH